MIDRVDNPLVPHEEMMRRALQQAERAFEADEVPVGSVIVHEGKVIGEGFNQRETLNDPTAHAEMIAMTQAAECLGSWRLLDCTLYVTLYPTGRFSFSFFSFFSFFAATGYPECVTCPSWVASSC